MNEFMSSRIDTMSGYSEGFAAVLPIGGPPLAVLRLWRADASEVNVGALYRLGLALRNQAKHVVFAQLADEQILTLDQLRTLADNDFEVVSVSSIHRMEEAVTDELIEEVREGIEQLAAGAMHVDAPVIDEEAARRVERANSEMTPLTSQEIDDFLAGHYRLGGSDDGTR